MCFHFSWADSYVVKFLELMLSVNFIKNCQSVCDVETVSPTPARPCTASCCSFSPGFGIISLLRFQTFLVNVFTHLIVFKLNVEQSLPGHLVGIYISFLGSLC